MAKGFLRAACSSLKNVSPTNLSQAMEITLRYLGERVQAREVKATTSKSESRNPWVLVTHHQPIVLLDLLMHIWCWQPSWQRSYKWKTVSERLTLGKVRSSYTVFASKEEFNFTLTYLTTYLSTMFNLLLNIYYLITEMQNLDVKKRGFIGVDSQFL